MTDGHSNTIAGWREWVRLPGVGVDWIKAKVDTGARTSSLHVFDVVEYEADGAERVAFSIHPWQRNDGDAVRTDLPVLDRRVVRSSSGHAERRVIVPMDVVLVGYTITAEVSLADRDEMGFRMLVGREALRQGFLVDPGRSYLGKKPRLAVRRKNRAADGA